VGEGTPRDYVTGESPKASEDAAADLVCGLKGQVIRGRDELFQFLRETGNTRLACEYPSAFCAFELALLDLYSRRIGVPIWKLFRHAPACDTIRYSAVLPLFDSAQRANFLNLVKKIGISQVKAKVLERAQAIELAREIFRVLGQETDLRFDANAAFSPTEALEIIEGLEKEGLHLSAFEQPVSKDDIKALAKIESVSSVPVIADESACTSQDVRTIIDERVCSGISIRLSKCGGMMKSIQLAEMASKAGLFCQLGCHVGETSILSAAGRHLACICGPFKYAEGSYSRFILERDVTETPCDFGQGGIAPILSEPGLGIEISDSALEAGSEKIAEFS